MKITPLYDNGCALRMGEVYDVKWIKDRKGVCKEIQVYGTNGLTSWRTDCRHLFGGWYTDKGNLTTNRNNTAYETAPIATIYEMDGNEVKEMKILQAYFNKGAKYTEDGKTYVFVEAVTLKCNNGRWCDQWNNPVDIHKYLEPYKEPEPKKRKRRV